MVVPDTSSIPSWCLHIGPLPRSCLGAAFIKVIVTNHFGFDTCTAVSESSLLPDATPLKADHCRCECCQTALMCQWWMAEGACMHELHKFDTATRAEQEGRGHLMGRVLPFQCIVPLRGQLQHFESAWTVNTLHIPNSRQTMLQTKAAAASDCECSAAHMSAYFNYAASSECASR